MSFQGNGNQQIFLWDTTDKEGEATSWPNEKHVFFWWKLVKNMRRRCHSKLTEHAAFLARRYDFGGELATSDLFTLMKPLNEVFVPKAVLTPSLGINSIQKYLWILRKKFKFQTTQKINCKHFQCLKQSLKVLLEIKFPCWFQLKANLLLTTMWVLSGDRW